MRRPDWRGLARDFALGAVLALGQAPLGLWPVALVALALGLARISSAPTPLRAAGRALVFGGGHFCLALSWIVQPFLVDAAATGWMAPFALPMLGFGLALFWAAAAWVTARLRGGALGLAITLPLAELARGHALTGFPWALPGHIWLDTPLIQMGALVGGYGLTALTVLAAALPVALGRRGLVLASLLALAACGWSWHRLSLPEPAAPGGTFRMVQPAIDQALKWDPDRARDNFGTLIRLSLSGPPPDLVIWPETAVPYTVEPGNSAAVAIADTIGAPVAAGAQRVEGPLAWNSLVLFGPDGRFQATYDKTHLVPFGEYVPLGEAALDIFDVTEFSARAGATYSAGTRVHPVDFGPGLGLARVLICYEAIFPGEVASPGPRPGWMLQVTNDAWFGTLTGPYQHFAITRLRAVEQGLPLVRVANTGISAVVDARGRIARDAAGAALLLPLGVRATLDAALPGALPAPPYAKTGDAPLLFLLLAGLGLLAWRARAPR
ncbi:apolipoprotein N-acyltransferase [Neotabrizicola sp. sgz301269]|uniref:apolipoprotein N-acyltransferase n=1 Tax=Neotabrizicola sp. sgz301269 TaxID=3276282 RepID=UPI003770085F